MLTPEQRIEAYTYAMFLILSDPDMDRRYPICGSLLQWYNEFYSDIGGPVNKLFPEFGKTIIPENTKKEEPWWPFTYEGNQIRLSVLSSCIEEAEQERKNQSS